MEKTSSSIEWTSQSTSVTFLPLMLLDIKIVLYVTSLTKSITVSGAVTLALMWMPVINLLLLVVHLLLLSLIHCHLSLRMMSRTFTLRTIPSETEMLWINDRLRRLRRRLHHQTFHPRSSWFLVQLLESLLSSSWYLLLLSEGSGDTCPTFIDLVHQDRRLGLHHCLHPSLDITSCSRRRML